MDQKAYREALEKCVRRAHENHNFITEEEYRGFFDGLGMNPTEDGLTRGYLENIRIRFGLYEPEKAEEVELTDEDGRYLGFYLKELEGLPQYTAQELLEITRLAIDEDKEARTKLLNAHLKDVVEIAKLYVYQSLPIEDLIGEGNIGLMMGVEALSCVDGPLEAEGFLGKMIMDSMDAAISRDTDDREQWDEVLSRIEKISEKAKELSDDLRRAVTAEELAEEGGFDAEDIYEALRLTGNKIEGLHRGGEEK